MTNATRTGNRGRNGGLASDERATIRRAKFRPTYGCGAFGPSYLGQKNTEPPRDLLAERAAWRRRNPGTPVLATGSPHRAPACWRLLGRLPTLPGDCCHGYPGSKCPHCNPYPLD